MDLTDYNSLTRVAHISVWLIICCQTMATRWPLTNVLCKKLLLKRLLNALNVNVNATVVCRINDD